jgi:hypothetical protein
LFITGKHSLKKQNSDIYHLPFHFWESRPSCPSNAWSKSTAWCARSVSSISVDAHRYAPSARVRALSSSAVLHAQLSRETIHRITKIKICFVCFKIEITGETSRTFGRK